MLAANGTKPEFRNGATGFISSVGYPFPSTRQVGVLTFLINKSSFVN